MKLAKLVLFFLFTEAALISSYSPGEQLNLTYENITDATYPCILINNSVYISGDSMLGDIECNITYSTVVYTEEVVVKSSGGGSNSGYRSAVRCTVWDACINNTATRLCTAGSKKYTQTKSCANITVNHTVETFKIVYNDSDYGVARIPEEINDSLQNVTTPEVSEPVVKDIFILVLFGIVLLAIVFGILIFGIYQQNKKIKEIKRRQQYGRDKIK